MTQSKAQTISDALRNLEPPQRKAAMLKLSQDDPAGWAEYLATLTPVDSLEAMREAAKGHPEP